MLEHYKQHTQHCRSCQEALLVVQRLQALLLIYFVITVCVIALLPDRLQLTLSLPLLANDVIFAFQIWFNAAEQRHLHDLLNSQIEKAWQEKVLGKLDNLIDNSTTTSS
ncbi:MAG: hypothetical protein ICV54_10845 [Nostoc sp. C3-bin3]|nr:hypothetical protein [Nostoc sp. C3-bin3]